MTWACFDVATGEIKDWRFGGSARLASMNLPQGCVLLLGRFDRLSQRVDIAALRAAGAEAEPINFVVDYQPPSPGAEYEWDAERRRYRLRRAIALARNRDAAARQQIDRLESRQHRIIRERLIATLPDGPVKTALVDIDTQIAALRADLIQQP
jgi:hypothetical protein